jgi:uncharacterized protein involved in oxidation of intracellular sulfur
VASILFQGSHGSDDPTLAAMPFIGANGAIEAGHQASIVLIAEATLLMKDVIADAITPVGFPPLNEHIAKAIASRIPIHI